MLNPPPLDVDAANIVIVRSVEPPVGEVGPATDWVYRVFIPDIELPNPAGLTGYPGTVTVQVLSGADRRSPLPQPAIARRRLFGPPDPLTALASAEFTLATRPDFEGNIGARITWGPRTARSSGRESIRLGTYTVEDALIRIHPVLDASDVPRYFVEWVVYHEMLHQVHEIPVVNGRHHFHTPAFGAHERTFEWAEASERWEKENLNRLLYF